MPFRYKIDVLAALKNAGYSTYRIRKEKFFSESTLQCFRNDVPVSWDTIAILCRLLSCQLGDLIEYIPDDAASPSQNDQ